MADGGLALHPNFKSIAHKIESMDDLVRCFNLDDFIVCRSGYELYGKRDFLRKMGRLKVEKWNSIYVFNFRINYRKIDRFYIHDQVFGDGAELITYFRMDHGGRPVYIMLKLQVEGIEGALFFTFDPEIYLRVIVQWQDATMKVWQSLQDDGIVLKAPQKYDYFSPFEWDVVPPLRHMCILEVSNGIRRAVPHFENYQSILSATLATEVEKHLRKRTVEYDFYDTDYHF